MWVNAPPRHEVGSQHVRAKASLYPAIASQATFVLLLRESAAGADTTDWLADMLALAGQTSTRLGPFGRHVLGTVRVGGLAVVDRRQQREPRRNTAALPAAVYIRHPLLCAAIRGGDSPAEAQP